MRSYRVHIPSLTSQGALPVVINFHGGGGNAAGQQKYTGMDGLADQEGFIVVYPDGTGFFPNRLLTWNAGFCCGYSQVQAIDDVEFILNVLDDLAGQVPVDGTRIYATGLSNGAMMAYRLALEAPDRIAAIAPVGGMLLDDIPVDAGPVPVMHIHSIDDPRAPYEGGYGPPFPFTNARVRHFSVESGLAAWVEHNHCAADPTLQEVFMGEPGSVNESQTAQKWVFAPCDEGVQVVLWRLSGAGHVWPGGRQGYLESILGPGSTIIDANDEMWSFFTQFTSQ
jgi:polyhydroxybutyrate depolymerase